MLRRPCAATAGRDRTRKKKPAPLCVCPHVPFPRTAGERRRASQRFRSRHPGGGPGPGPGRAGGRAEHRGPRGAVLLPPAERPDQPPRSGPLGAPRAGPLPSRRRREVKTCPVGTEASAAAPRPTGTCLTLTELGLTRNASGLTCHKHLLHRNKYVDGGLSLNGGWAAAAAAGVSAQGRHARRAGGTAPAATRCGGWGRDSSRPGAAPAGRQSGWGSRAGALFPRGPDRTGPGGTRRPRSAPPPGGEGGGRGRCSPLAGGRGQSARLGSRRQGKESPAGVTSRGAGRWRGAGRGGRGRGRACRRGRGRGGGSPWGAGGGGARWGGGGGGPRRAAPVAPSQPCAGGGGGGPARRLSAAVATATCVPRGEGRR